jgi:hypothetical protein
MAATKKIQDGFLIHEIKTAVAMTVEPPVMMWTLNDAWSQKSDQGCDYNGRDKWQGLSIGSCIG